MVVYIYILLRKGGNVDIFIHFFFLSVCLSFRRLFDEKSIVSSKESSTKSSI